MEAKPLNQKGTETLQTFWKLLSLYFSSYLLKYRWTYVWPS